MVSYIPVLIEHPNDPVSEVEDISPVKVGHVVAPLLWWAVVQEVEDVFGGEWRLFQAPVYKIHHGGIADGVLK